MSLKFFVNVPCAMYLTVDLLELSFGDTIFVLMMRLYFGWITGC